MTLAQALIELIRSLPEILEMIKNLQKLAAKTQEERRVKDDIAKINKAFEDKDAKALNDIFNNN